MLFSSHEIPRLCISMGTGSTIVTVGSGDEVRVVNRDGVAIWEYEKSSEDKR